MLRHVLFVSNFYFILYGCDLRAREKCGWLIKWGNLYSECMGAPAYRDEFIVTLSHVRQSQSASRCLLIRGMPNRFWYNVRHWSHYWLHYHTLCSGYNHTSHWSRSPARNTKCNTKIGGAHSDAAESRAFDPQWWKRSAGGSHQPHIWLSY
jgi:hypothetical protein